MKLRWGLGAASVPRLLSACASSVRLQGLPNHLPVPGVNSHAYIAFTMRSCQMSLKVL